MNHCVPGTQILLIYIVYTSLIEKTQQHFSVYIEMKTWRIWSLAVEKVHLLPILPQTAVERALNRKYNIEYVPRQW